MKHLLCLIALSANLAYGQYTLKLNLEKGSTYSMKIASTLQFSSDGETGKIYMNATLTAFSSSKVVQVSDTGYELEVRYDSVHWTMKSPMGQLEFRSNDSLLEGTTHPGMARHPIKIFVLKNGAISKIGHPDSSGFAAMLKNFPMLDGIKKMMLMSHPKSKFDGQTMKQDLEKMTAIFPDNKVSLNGSWGSTIHPDSNMANSISNHYTLVDYHGGTATIKGHGETKLIKSPKQGISIVGNSDIEGQSESTVMVNAATGWVQQGEFSSGLKGQVQFHEPSAKQGENKTINFELKVHTSLSGY